MEIVTNTFSHAIFSIFSFCIDFSSVSTVKDLIDSLEVIDKHNLSEEQKHVKEMVFFKRHLMAIQTSQKRNDTGFFFSIYSWFSSLPIFLSYSDQFIQSKSKFHHLVKFISLVYAESNFFIDNNNNKNRVEYKKNIPPVSLSKINSRQISNFISQSTLIIKKIQLLINKIDQINNSFSSFYYRWWYHKDICKLNNYKKELMCDISKLKMSVIKKVGFIVSIPNITINENHIISVLEDLSYSIEGDKTQKSIFFKFKSLCYINYLIFDSKEDINQIQLAPFNIKDHFIRLSDGSYAIKSKLAVSLLKEYHNNDFLVLIIRKINHSRVHRYAIELLNFIKKKDQSGAEARIKSCISTFYSFLPQVLFMCLQNLKNDYASLKKLYNVNQFFINVLIKTIGPKQSAYSDLLSKYKKLVAPLIAKPESKLVCKIESNHFLLPSRSLNKSFVLRRSNSSTCSTRSRLDYFHQNI